MQKEPTPSARMGGLYLPLSNRRGSSEVRPWRDNRKASERERAIRKYQIRADVILKLGMIDKPWVTFNIF